MLKKVAFNFLATIFDLNYKKEYKEALNIDVQVSLRNLLIHAYTNVLYYHDIFSREGIVKKGDLLLNNFEKIPILTRNKLQTQFNKLTSLDYNKRKWSINTSGGSTGEPVKFIRDEASAKWESATRKFYYRNMLGVDEIFARKILLWISEQPKNIFKLAEGKLRNTLTNTVIFNWFDVLTEDYLRRLLKLINSYKPEIIRGYSGALYEFCRFVQSKNLYVFSPKIVVCTAEPLYETREKIESVFGTKVYDLYGSREVDGIAGECKYGLLHIFMFNNYLELLNDNNRKVKEGEAGKVIVSTLHNYSMPLIRYDIGDVAILGPEECKCGNPLPTLKRVMGRQIDYFLREDGKKIYGGYFIKLLRSQEWVKAFKVIQEDYKKLRILLELRDKNIADDKKREIERKIKAVMDNDCQINWEIVDRISKTRMGKHLHIQSMLKD